MIGASLQFEVSESVTRAVRDALEAQRRKWPTTAIAIVTGGSRGTAVNAMIAEVQARLGRNPFYLVDPWLQSIREMLRFAAARPGGYTLDDLHAVGQRMLENVRDNVARQQTKGGGAFTPLTDAYAREKAKRHPGRPILVATGDLVGGLHVEIERR